MIQSTTAKRENARIDDREEVPTSISGPELGSASSVPGRGGGEVGFDATGGGVDVVIGRKGAERRVMRTRIVKAGVAKLPVECGMGGGAGHRLHCAG